MSNDSDFNVSWDADSSDFLIPYGDFRNQHWASTVQLAYLTVIFVIGIPTNCLVSFIQIKCKDKSTTDYYIASLAMFDLLSASVYIPLRLSSYSRTIWTAIASNFVCGIRLYLVYMLSLASVVLLTTISADRYFKTCRPFSRSYTNKSAKIICLSLSAASILICTPILMTFRKAENLRCVLSSDYYRFIKIWRYSITGLSIFSSVATSYFYSRIYLTLKMRRRARISQNLNKSTSIQQSSENEDVKICFKCIYARRSGKVKPIKKYCETSDQHLEENRTCVSTNTNVFLRSDTSIGEHLKAWRTTTLLKNTVHPEQVVALSSKPDWMVQENVREELQLKETSERPRKSSAAGCTEKLVHTSGDTLGSDLHSAGIVQTTEQSEGEPKKNCQPDATGISIQTNDEVGKHSQQRRLERKTKPPEVNLCDLRLSRTTRTMLVISVTYILLCVTSWINAFFKKTFSGSALSVFASSFYLFHNIVNPLLYMSMSTKFHEEIRKFVRWK